MASYRRITPDRDAIRAVFETVYQPRLGDLALVRIPGGSALMWVPVAETWWQRVARRITKRPAPETCPELERLRAAATWEAFEPHYDAALATGDFSTINDLTQILRVATESFIAELTGEQT